jgi:outer membrane receptor for ferrienterochelin and colicin
MSLIVDCKFCGERISLRKMPHGKHVPFDANTDDQHNCQKSKKQKKQTKKQTKKIKSSSNNDLESSTVSEDFYNYDENSNLESNTTKSKDIFEDETLDSLKNEIEVETKEKKVNTSTFLIIGLVLVIGFLLFKQ